jgi:hypothetical protein
MIKKQCKKAVELTIEQNGGLIEPKMQSLADYKTRSGCDGVPPPRAVDEAHLSMLWPSLFEF